MWIIYEQSCEKRWHTHREMRDTHEDDTYAWKREMYVHQGDTRMKMTHTHARRQHTQRYHLRGQPTDTHTRSTGGPLPRKHESAWLGWKPADAETPYNSNLMGKPQATGALLETGLPGPGPKPGKVWKLIHPKLQPWDRQEHEPLEDGVENCQACPQLAHLPWPTWAASEPPEQAKDSQETWGSRSQTLGGTGWKATEVLLGPARLQQESFSEEKQCGTCGGSMQRPQSQNRGSATLRPCHLGKLLTFLCFRITTHLSYEKYT